MVEDWNLLFRAKERFLSRLMRVVDESFYITNSFCYFIVVTAKISKQNSYRHCTSPVEMLKENKPQLKTLVLIITEWCSSRYGTNHIASGKESSGNQCFNFHWTKRWHVLKRRLKTFESNRRFWLPNSEHPVRLWVSKKNWTPSESRPFHNHTDQGHLKLLTRLENGGQRAPRQTLRLLSAGPGRSEVSSTHSTEIKGSI